MHTCGCNYVEGQKSQCLGLSHLLEVWDVFWVLSLYLGSMVNLHLFCIGLMRGSWRLSPYKQGSQGPKEADELLNVKADYVQTEGYIKILPSLKVWDQPKLLNHQENHFWCPYRYNHSLPQTLPIIIQFGEGFMTSSIRRGPSSCHGASRQWLGEK